MRKYLKEEKRLLNLAPNEIRRSHSLIAAVVTENVVLTNTAVVEHVKSQHVRQTVVSSTAHASIQMKNVVRTVSTVIRLETPRAVLVIVVHAPSPLVPKDIISVVLHRLITPVF